MVHLGALLWVLYDELAASEVRGVDAVVEFGYDLIKQHLRLDPLGVSCHAFGDTEFRQKKNLLN